MKIGYSDTIATNIPMYGTVGAKEMFTLLKQQKIFLAKQGIKFHISLSLLSSGVARGGGQGGHLPPGAARRGAPKSCQDFFKNLYKEKF